MIGVAAHIGGRTVGIAVNTPGDRKMDEALATQDEAAETTAQGAERPPRSSLDALLDRPGPLDRFLGNNDDIRG
jgi:hypothetical protein